MAFSLPVPLPQSLFAQDLARGLRGRPKHAAPKYFYDEAGSALFDQICERSEYYLTRAELSILHEHAGSLASRVGAGVRVVELGSGSGAKTRPLLDALDRPEEYLAVDVSTGALEAAGAALREAYPALHVISVRADFTSAFALPVPSPRVRETLVYFPGSTIGNLVPSDAIELMHRVRAACGRCSMVLGVDLKKAPARLHAAYNDAGGVTAAFNKNLLVRANRELGTDFEVDSFAHYAFYAPVPGRIEMHLVSSKRQRVELDREGFVFEQGESILTEYSYKYTAPEVAKLASRGGFRVAAWYTDSAEDFAVAFLESV
jgi:dimethylhistidine N-methyltransferase